MAEITDLATCSQFILSQWPRPEKITVPSRIFCRIRQQIRNLSPARETSYRDTLKDERWLWHERRAAMRRSDIRVCGVRIEREGNP